MPSIGNQLKASISCLLTFYLSHSWESDLLSYEAFAWLIYGYLLYEYKDTQNLIRNEYTFYSTQVCMDLWCILIQFVSVKKRKKIVLGSNFILFNVFKLIFMRWVVFISLFQQQKENKSAA